MQYKDFGNTCLA